MRCDQWEGLNPWAQKFVEGTRVLDYLLKQIKIYPDGRREVLPTRKIFVSTVKKQASERSFEGFDTWYLSDYIFPDGKIFREVVQTTPWSSGPMIYTALQDENNQWVKESLWSQKEIDGPPRGDQ